MMHKLTQMLQPAWLSKLDRHLLLHYRLLWSTRAHYLLFYGLSGSLLLTLLLSIYPLSPANLPSREVVIFTVAVLSVLGAGFWIYQQSFYQLESNFSRQIKGLPYLRMVIYLGALLFFIALPLWAGWLTEERIRQEVSVEELSADIRQLMLGNVYFPGEGQVALGEGNKPGICTTHFYYYHNEDCGLAHHHFAENLPGEWKNMGYAYGMDQTFFYREISDSLLVMSFIKTTSDARRLELISGYIATCNKYGARLELSAEQVLKDYHKGTENRFVDKDNRLAVLKANIAVIAEAHRHFTRFYGNEPSLWVTLLSLAVILSSLLQAYQHVSLRRLMIAMGAGIALIIGNLFITGLLAGEFGSQSPQLVFMGFTAIFLIAVFQAVSISKQKVFSMVKMVSLIIANVMVPVMPTILVAALNDSVDYAFTDSLMLAGVLTYLLIWLPVFHQLYIKQRGLPEVA